MQSLTLLNSDNKQVVNAAVGFTAKKSYLRAVENVKKMKGLRANELLLGVMDKNHLLASTRADKKKALASGIDPREDVGMHNLDISIVLMEMARIRTKNIAASLKKMAENVPTPEMAQSLAKIFSERLETEVVDVLAFNDYILQNWWDMGPHSKFLTLQKILSRDGTPLMSSPGEFSSSLMRFGEEKKYLRAKYNTEKQQGTFYGKKRRVSFDMGQNSAPPVFVPRQGQNFRPFGPGGPQNNQNSSTRIPGPCNVYNRQGWCRFEWMNGGCRYRHVCNRCGKEGHYGGRCEQRNS